MWDELWIDDDFYKILERIIHRIYKIDEQGKAVPMMKSQHIVSPWVSIGKNTNRYCSIWMDLYYKIFNIYPSYCKDRCFKVVAYPKNCKETFELYEVMKEYNIHSKIGIDLRDYTPDKSSNFSAFFYCEDQEHGQKVYEEVKELVKKVNPEMVVLLKKSCTEMELEKDLKPNPEWEKRLDDIFPKHELNESSPDWVDNRTKVYWLKHARAVGDLSYREVSSLPADEGKYELYQEEK